MKILHIIGGGDVGGAKSHVLFLVKELSKYIDIKIISLRHGIFSDDAIKMGINIEIVRTGNILGDVERIVAIIRKEGYDLLHSHGAKANMYAIILKNITGLPTVTTVHSDYKLDYMHNIYKRLTFGTINSIALRFIGNYIAISRNFKEMLIRRGFDPSRIYTLYNCIDFDRPMKSYSRSEFLEKYKIRISGKDIIVGTVARLEPVKGLDTLLMAAKIVLESSPSVKFIIGGDGECRKALINKAAELNISESVIFPGWVDDPYEFMNAIDIHVMTSLSESFPYTILEGARYKKLTISSDVGGISDLIESGVNGYLFNVGDYKTLAGYILKLVNDTDLRMKMGEYLYQKAKAKFSIGSMARTQLQIYEGILGRESAKARTVPEYDIIISGYYGSGNIGDDAILTSIINDLRKHRQDVRIIVLSRNPAETRQNYQVDSLNWLNIFKIIRAMKHSALFINGGGSLIQDITSTRSLMYRLVTIWLAKKTGMKVMVYANGIGPVTKFINKLLTRKIINTVDVITLREEEPSVRELDKLSISRPRVVVTADPALTIDPVDNGEIDRLLLDEGIEPAENLAGFSIREWKGYEKKYEGVISQIVDYMIEAYGIKPVFIPMHYPGDLRVAQRIISRMKGRGYVIRNKYSVRHVFGIVKKMKILVGMRLHALIFAASLGIPVVGLVYEPKVEGFLKYIDQADACAGNVTQLDYGKLRQVIDHVWARREEISRNLLSISVMLKEKAVANAEIAIGLLDSTRSNAGGKK